MKLKRMKLKKTIKRQAVALLMLAVLIIGGGGTYQSFNSPTGECC